MKYNRFALDQVGGMKLIYNRYGEIVDTVGSVKGRRYQGCAYNNTSKYYPTAPATTTITITIKRWY
jgi:hypothetical protein